MNTSKFSIMKTIRILTFLTVMLFTTATFAQTAEVFYSPKLPQVEMSEAKTALSLILKETGNYNHPKLIHIKGFRTPKDVSVYEDRIEITIKPHNLTIHFFDLNNYTIQIIQIIYPTYSFYNMKLGELEFTFFYKNSKSDPTILNFKKLADYLLYFRHQSNIKLYDSLIVQFKPIAAKYNTLKVKPTVTEEQRKYIVQANLFNRKKQYTKAIELYTKAIEVDQTAYPAAYSNLALLSAQINQFYAAIYNMKKFLMLESESLDARSAQDKIYEWEAQINQ